MKKQFYHYIQILLLPALLVACEDTLFSSEGETEDAGLESFCVEFNVVEAVNADDTPITRSAPNDVDNTKVSNVWVFQFDGTTEKLQTTPRYVEAKANGSLSIGAIPSDNDKTRLLFIANTNLSDINWKATKGVTTYQQILQISGSRYYEHENYGMENRNLVMCGTYQGTIKLGETLTPTLYRSVAKIELTLSVKEKTPYEVQTVRLCNVPNSIYWSAPLLPAPAGNDLLPKALESRFGKGPNTTTEFPIAGGDAVTYTWYLPTNIRGTSKSESSKDKNRSAPANATFIEIGVKDNGFSGAAGRFYRIYPGANMTNDFNIRPNRLYKLSLTLTEKTTEDSRIEIAQNKILGESNCYLLNPPPAGSKAIEFSIPVVDRANRFYGRPSYKDINKEVSFEGFKDKDSDWECRVIWCDNPELLPYGQTTTPSANKLYISQATNNAENSKYMKVVLPPLTPQQYGNILIGIYKKGEDKCRWSWHLWVTDYNPNVSISTAPDRFAFDVPNGQVVRFACALFGYTYVNPFGSTNVLPSVEYTRTYITATEPNLNYPYREGYLMDRNLGARAPYGSSTDVAGLVYQYGRKDPFVIQRTRYNAGGTPIEPVVVVNSYFKYTDTKDAMSGVNYLYTMSDAHENPTTIFTNNNNAYLGLAVVGSTSFEGAPETAYYTWHDILLPFKVGTAPAPDVAPWNQFRKSLFDPCPEGWQVMNKEVTTQPTPNPTLMSEVTASRVPASSKSNNGMNDRGLSMNGIYGEGLYYWPDIYRTVAQKDEGIGPVEGVIFLPKTTLINSYGYYISAESITSSDQYYSYWLGSRENNTNGAALLFNGAFPRLGYYKGNDNKKPGVVKSEACPIRCVKTPVTPTP